jgi:hypothetical protein
MELATKVSIFAGCQALMLFMAIHAYNNIRLNKKAYLVREALVAVEDSAWRRLLHSRDDGSLRLLTSLDFASFERLYADLFTFEEIASELARRNGRRSLLTLKDKLGVYLFYIGSRMTESEIGMLFGVLQCTVSQALRYIVPLVSERMVDNPMARIAFPTEAEMHDYAEMVMQREPDAEDVMGFLDGCAMPIHCSWEDNPSYHSDYHGTTCVNNVFLFSPAGTILYAAFNYPGRWHDSRVATKLVEVVKAKIGRYKYALIRDSGELVICTALLWALYRRNASEHWNPIIAAFSSENRTDMCVYGRRPNGACVFYRARTLVSSPFCLRITSSVVYSCMEFS